MPILEGIALASLIGAGCGRLGWFAWAQRKRVLHPSDEILSRSLLREIDGCEFDETPIPGGEGRVIYSRPRRSKIAEMVWRAKLKYGTIERSEVNVAMVSKFIRDELKDDKVRPSHCLAIYPFAVAAFFSEFQPEIDARRAQVSAESKKKERAKGREYWSLTDWLRRLPCSLVEGSTAIEVGGLVDPLDE